METSPRRRRRRPGLRPAVGGVSLAVALAIAALVPVEVYGPPAVRRQIGLAVVALGITAGVRESDGSPILREPLPVVVNQEGGALWLHAPLEAAVEADPAFALGSGGHLVRAEVVGAPHRFALRLSLFRQGWSVALPQAERVRLAAWIATLAGCIGALVAWATRRVAWGLLAAGAVGQGLARVGSWPRPPGDPTWTEAWTEGPLGRGLVLAARTLPDAAFAWGAGLVVLCGVLMVFDHRRSPQRGPSLLVFGALGLLGALAWVEAALRTGWLGFATTAPGLVGSIALVLGWAALGSWARSGRAA